MSESVVERLRRAIAAPTWATRIRLDTRDAEALLAAVEAAREVARRSSIDYYPRDELDVLEQALDALFATAPEGE